MNQENYAAEALLKSTKVIIPKHSEYQNLPNAAESVSGQSECDPPPPAIENAVPPAPTKLSHFSTSGESVNQMFEVGAAGSTYFY